MIYLLAILIPPLALLIQGKIFQALFNAFFWVIGLFFLLFFGWILWGLTVLHAVVVINGVRSDARTQKIVDAIKAKEG